MVNDGICRLNTIWCNLCEPLCVQLQLVLFVCKDTSINATKDRHVSGVNPSNLNSVVRYYKYTSSLEEVNIQSTSIGMNIHHLLSVFVSINEF